MRNGKKSVPESDVESLSSGDENEELSSRKKSPRKPLPKSKSAKDTVLGSSESDLSDEDKPSAKKKAKKAKYHEFCLILNTPLESPDMSCPGYLGTIENRLWD